MHDHVERLTQWIVAATHDLFDTDEVEVLDAPDLPEDAGALLQVQVGIPDAGAAWAAKVSDDLVCAIQSDPDIEDLLKVVLVRERDQAGYAACVRIGHHSLALEEAPVVFRREGDGQWEIWLADEEDAEDIGETLRSAILRTLLVWTVPDRQALPN